MTETMNTTTNHYDVQAKMAAIMADNERAADIMTGFVMAFELLHDQRNDDQQGA